MNARFLAAAACLLLTAPAAAQSIAGEWDAAMNTPGGVRPFKILFVVDGDKVTGTVKRTAGDVPLTGSLKGDTVGFSYTIDYNGNALVMTVIARVAGDSLKGIVDFGGNAQDEFWAARVPAVRKIPEPAEQPPDAGKGIFQGSPPCDTRESGSPRS
jgi:hypothetical protein